MAVHKVTATSTTLDVILRALRHAAATVESGRGDYERVAGVVEDWQAKIRGPVTKVRVFDSTREAYDETQTNEEINDGDVLHVPSERVVGFLVQAWPTALTAERGEFHGLREDADPRELEDGRYVESVELAESLITEHGYEPWRADR